ncbi:MAG: hypothetical protein ABIK68_08555, partial [bacterium]
LILLFFSQPVNLTQQWGAPKTCGYVIITASRGYLFRKMHESIPGFQGFLNKQPLSAYRYPHILGAPVKGIPI